MRTRSLKYLCLGPDPSIIIEHHRHYSAYSGRYRGALRKYFDVVAEEAIRVSHYKLLAVKRSCRY